MANQCKYFKQVLQVSYDSGVTWVNIGETRKGDLYEYNSPACGAVTEYRWVDVTGQYTCDGTTKYQKTKKQYSTDGTTWQDVSPAEYGKGDVIEYDSTDCGGGCEDNYLTFEAVDGGTFKFSGNSISYSLDNGSTWTTLASDTNSPTVQAGNNIMWKGNLTQTSGSIGRFSSTGRFSVKGNIMSLLYGDNYASNLYIDENSTNVFGSMFRDCTGLVNAGCLILPINTAFYCYFRMFEGCSSLTTTPKLTANRYKARFYAYAYMFAGCSSITTAPAIPLYSEFEEGSFYGMFSNCTSLVTAPALPSTNLSEWCYAAMFQGCTALTTAPELPATAPSWGSYAYMFKNCTSLNYIKCLATNLTFIGQPDATVDWVSGVASSGTFVKASSMNSWTRGESGIPTNWTIQNA